MKNLIFLALFLVDFCFWSCQKDPVQPPPPPKPYQVLSVEVSPSYAELDVNINTKQQFTAKVNYTGEGKKPDNIDAVTWKVTGTDSGTVTQNGFYTVGENHPNGGVDTVWAISQFDTTKRGFAVVNVGFYHPEGTEWVRYVGYGPGSFGVGVATDQNNNVIFGSNVTDKDGNLIGTRIASIDKNGKTRWTVDPTKNANWPQPNIGQFTTPDGINFYFTAGTGNPGSLPTITLGEVTSDGQLLIKPEQNILYHGTSFSITNDGNYIYLGGYDETREAYVYVTDLQGNFVRKIRLKPGDNGKPFVTGLFYKDGFLYTAFDFVAPTGNSSLGGMVQKWDLSNDTMVWQKFYDDVVTPFVVVNNDGVVYFLGTIFGGNHIWFAAGLDESGNELWQQFTQISGGTNGNEIRRAALTKDGNAVAVGHVLNPSDAAVWILNQYGRELRVQRIDLGDWEFMQSVAVDNENRIYISGSVYPPGINIPVAVVAKLD
jgi:hypothetical protein